MSKEQELVDIMRSSGSPHRTAEEIKRCWVDLLNYSTVWEVFQSLTEYEEIVSHPDIQQELDLIPRMKRMKESGCRYVINPHTDLYGIAYHLVAMKDDPFKDSHEILSCFLDNSLNIGQKEFAPLKNSLIAYSINMKIGTIDGLPLHQNMVNLVKAKCKCAH